MGHLSVVSRPTNMFRYKGVVKNDINADYDTYGQEGDVDYITNENVYYEGDYDSMETSQNATDLRVPETNQQPKWRIQRTPLIICIIASLLIIAVGAGVGSIVLLFPSTMQQNDTIGINTNTTFATDGAWGAWSDYGTCSQKCGGGFMTRERSCDSPPPSPDGKPCPGDDSQDKRCNLHCCAEDGGWGVWSNDGSCSASCGGGSQRMARLCNSPAPSCGGRQCSGPADQAVDCNTQCCAVDGGWSSWTSYGSCSKACGGGKKKRTRSCTNPRPSCGGRSCAGTSSQEAACNTHCCTVNGGWSAWSGYGACSKSCGGGMKTRTRTCTSPAPSCGGAKCAGDADQESSCNTQCCAFDGSWSSWSSWSGCFPKPYSSIDKECLKEGEKVRSRSCSSSCGGAKCPGEASENQRCLWQSPNSNGAILCPATIL